MIDISGPLGRTGSTTWRPLALSAIGPATVLAGLVWAIAQPFRLTVLDLGSHGIWDHLAQPPVLVAGVGILFHVAIARPLLRALQESA